MQIVRDKKAVLSRVVGVAIVLVIFGFMFRTLYLDGERIVTYRWHLNCISSVPWVVGFMSPVTLSGLGGDGGHPGLLAELLPPGNVATIVALRIRVARTASDMVCAIVAWRL